MTHSQTDTGEPGEHGARKPDPAEGLRLLKAFMTITDPKTRSTAIEFVESLANSRGQGAG